MNQLIECKPSDYVEIEEVMTNCDHSIDEEVASKLKKGKYWSKYSGWNFCGYVWWDKSIWSCEIWVYHSHVKTVSADTLQEIMGLVSVEFGNE